MKVLVLCAANIGRSPVAEVLLKDLLAKGLGVPTAQLAEMVQVMSAGTEAPEGHPASPRGVRIMADRGLDLTEHNATRLTTTALREADFVFGMDVDQLTAVEALEPAAAAKTQLLAGEGREIPDPHHHSDEFFAAVCSQIERAVADRVLELVMEIRARAADSDAK